MIFDGDFTIHVDGKPKGTASDSLSALRKAKEIGEGASISLEGKILICLGVKPIPDHQRLKTMAILAGRKR